MTDEKWQAYTDGEDTIYGTSPEEAVEAYRLEVGLDPDDMGKPEDFHPVDHSKIQRVRDDDSGLVEHRTIGEWIEWNQSQERPSRMICTRNW